MLALAVLACSSSPQPPAPQAGQPDIVLVLTSGLREDVVPGAGATSVFIQATGVTPTRRHTAAYSQTVQPYTAFGALLTGRYPSAIPLCSTPARREPDDPVPFCVELAADKPTMPEVLSLYGYQTALVTIDASDLLPLARGFQQTIEIRGDVPEQSWPRAAQQAAAWWSATAEHPRLLVIAGQLHTRELEGAGITAHNTLRMSEAEQADYLETRPWFARRLNAGMEWPIVTDAGREVARQAYDDAARRLGVQVRSTLSALEWSRPRWTFISALHGVTLGEDTGCRSPEQLRVGSHIVLLDRTLRVPLLVYGPTPAEQTTTVDHPVELIDLLPSITGLAEALPPASLPGADLLSPSPDPSTELAYSEFGDMLALRSQGTMLTFRSQLHGVTSADPRLTERLLATAPMSLSGQEVQMRSADRPPYYEYLMHEVREDPLQRAALAVGEDEERFMEMVALLLAHRTGPGAPPTGTLSWEQIQELRRDGALHYW